MRIFRTLGSILKRGKSICVAEAFYTLTLPLIKISILLFYRGIFLGRRFEIMTYIIGAFVLAWFAAGFFLGMFGCHPIRANWDVNLDPITNCVNQRAEYIGTSIPNILADFAILCLPVYPVWHLQMSRRSKSAVFGMFLLGGL